RSDAIVGTMPNLATHVHEVSQANAPVYCVPMGVAPEQAHTYHPLEPDFLQRYLSSPAMKVVHAGTIGITNALEIFFAAAARLQGNADIQFILVGDGALKQQYNRQYEHLPHGVIAPKVDRSQVPAVVEQADVAYVPTHPPKRWDSGRAVNK